MESRDVTEDAKSTRHRHFSIGSLLDTNPLNQLEIFCIKVAAHTERDSHRETRRLTIRVTCLRKLSLTL